MLDIKDIKATTVKDKIKQHYTTQQVVSAFKGMNYAKQKQICETIFGIEREKLSAHLTYTREQLVQMLTYDGWLLVPVKTIKNKTIMVWFNLKYASKDF